MANAWKDNPNASKDTEDTNHKAGDDQNNEKDSTAQNTKDPDEDHSQHISNDTTPKRNHATEA